MPAKKMDELFESQAPAVSTLDRKSVELCIFTCIGDYLNFIGVEMTDTQILETAQMMIDTHPYIQIDAIKTFFYECKRGTYGFHYNKMDGSKLLIWYDKFVNDYYNKLDDMQYAKHLAIKNGSYDDGQRTGDVISPAELADTISRILHNGKGSDDCARENEIADIRKRVIRKYEELLQTDPDAAKEIIEKEITNELTKANIITF